MHDGANPTKLPALEAPAPEAMAGFEALDRAALAEGAIPRKYRSRRRWP